MNAHYDLNTKSQIIEIWKIVDGCGWVKISWMDAMIIINGCGRVDLYFENYQILVRQNQKTVSGETIIAKKK